MIPSAQQTKTCYEWCEKTTWAARQNPVDAHRAALIALEIYERGPDVWSKPTNEERFVNEIKAEFKRQHRHKYGFVWWVVLLQVILPIIINAIIEWLRNREKHLKQVADQARRVT